MLPHEMIATLRDGYHALALGVRLARELLPQVDIALDQKWGPLAAAIPDPELRRQAQASLHGKRFQSEGGAAYALLPEGIHSELLTAIVALQTLADYLDNLCDRSTSRSPEDYRALHDAWLDAFSPEPPTGDYYRLHPEKDDGGYLAALVAAGRAGVLALPSYAAVAPDVRRLAALYVENQVLQHLPPSERPEALRAWHARDCGWPGLKWWEFAAASAGTIGIYALLRAATAPGLERPRIDTILERYYPWFNATNTLLDHYVDQQEDADSGDLNYIALYPAEQRDEQLAAILRRVIQEASQLPDARFHQVVARGMPALYLSEKKMQGPERRAGRKRMLRAIGVVGWALYLLVRAVRARRPSQA
ncbi:DUF2600 family protein [Hyalangium gracile]|uniref:DUF2600 family protein n=1 Tax=Hyalangium gracile TaxID=394092 RepID=UPI001CCB0B67|nr:DUF2600 family protein [Hyalangium gracile]